MDRKKNNVGESWEKQDIICIKLPDPEDVLTDYKITTVLSRQMLHNFIPYAHISDFEAVSEDGKKILVEIFYVTISEGKHIFYKKPYFYDINSMSLEPIRP